MKTRGVTMVNTRDTLLTKKKGRDPGGTRGRGEGILPQGKQKTKGGGKIGGQCLEMGLQVKQKKS